MGIFTWLTNKSVESFAKGIAETQLKTLRSLQQRKPELAGESLYVEIIALRPFYNSEKAKQIIQGGKETFERNAWMRTEKRPFGFRDVVELLIQDEYFKTITRRSQKDDATAMLLIKIAVRDIIPEDL